MDPKRAVCATILFLASMSGAVCLKVYGQSSAQGAGQPAIARKLGAIKAINGDVITLAPDSGPDVTVTVQPNARILSIAPGEKDLKNASPIQLQALTSRCKRRRTPYSAVTLPIR
jgi:hypothetical protein